MKFAPFFCALSFFALISNANALPKIEHWTTPAGTRVYFVENHDLPILDVQINFAAGSAYDPPEKAGLAALTHALLDTEIPGMDENKIAEKAALRRSRMTEAQRKKADEKAAKKAKAKGKAKKATETAKKPKKAKAKKSNAKKKSD